MPAFALGTWLGMDAQQNRLKPTANEIEQAVLWGLDAGYTHIDTAYIYGIEDQVGRALSTKFAQGLKREDVFVTTKLYNDSHAQDAVVPALRRSLKNLNLDYVDLYLIHWPMGIKADGTYDHTDYLETWQGMMEAKRVGLTKSIGVSNFNKEQIGRLMEFGLEKPAVLEIEVNLNLQQRDLLAYCEEQNIVVMGYTPFGSLLQDKPTAAAPPPPPKVDDPALVKIAKKYNKTVPQIVLRYLIELGVVPLPKSVTKARIEQNLNVFDFKLTYPDRDILRAFDANYRTISVKKWSDHPYYPFEKD